MRYLLLGLGLFFTSCAGDKADLEEARYLLGKGDVGNATKALSIIEPKLTTLTGSDLVEAYRLWAGAEMQSAGVDSIQIISTIIYKTSNDTVALTKDALKGLTDDSKTKIRLARDNLTTFTSNAAFTNASLREQQGIYYQIGLANFLDSLRVALQVTGVTAGTFDVSTCATKFGPSGEFTQDLSDVGTGLAGASTNFTNAGLDSTNSIVTLTQTMQSSVETSGVADAALFCNYINTQKGL